MAEHAEKTARKTIALPDRLWDAIDEYRHAERIRTQRAAIERLLQLGLDAAAGGSGRPTPRTTLRTGYVRVLVFCNSCRYQADANLQRIGEAFASRLGLRRWLNGMPVASRRPQVKVAPAEQAKPGKAGHH